MARVSLTIATIAGPKYSGYIDNWKKHLPTWCNVFVYSDDSKGIYEAKRRALEDIKSDYVWFIDVDDIVNLHIREEFMNSLVNANKPDKIILESDGRMLWQYIFRTDWLKACYAEVEGAKQKAGVTCLNLVSCEDMIVTATKKWDYANVYRLPNKGILHTINDTSSTSSTKYDLAKIKSLYRNFDDLLAVARYLDFNFICWIVFSQCKGQYYNLYRPYVEKSELALCDKYITKLYKEISKYENLR